MADENIAPNVVGDIRLKVTLGPNPVVKPKKAYFDWTPAAKLKFVEYIKHRNAHLPKKKGGLPVPALWELVKTDMAGNRDKLFEEYVVEWKVLQSTWIRFGKDILRSHGVEKDAINLSGLKKVDGFSALVLEMEEEKFRRTKSTREKSELEKAKFKILGKISGSMNKSASVLQVTPPGMEETEEEVAEQADEGPTPSTISARSKSTPNAAASILAIGTTLRELLEKGAERFKPVVDVEMRDKKLAVLDNQAEYFALQVEEMRERKRRKLTSSSSSHGNMRIFEDSE